MVSSPTLFFTCSSSHHARDLSPEPHIVDTRNPPPPYCRQTRNPSSSIIHVTKSLPSHHLTFCKTSPSPADLLPFTTAMAQNGSNGHTLTVPPTIASLEGKIALVTGSSQGIGRAICVAYAAAGAHVVCADIRPEPSKSESSSTPTHELLNSQNPTSGSGSSRAIFVNCNVTKATEVQSAVAKAVETYGRLDIMVNNAGVAAGTGLRCHELSEESFDTSIAVNCKGVWLGCKYATAQFLAQEPHVSGDRGWVINTSSIYGLVGGSQSSGYCAAKGAVTNMTKSIALEYATDRIHINSIHPGFTETNMLDAVRQGANNMTEITAKHPWGRLGNVEDLAKMAVFLAGDGASWITGQQFVVDGGYTAQ